MTHLANAFCNMLVVSNEDVDLREAGVEEFLPHVTRMSDSSGDTHFVIFEDDSIFLRQGNSVTSYNGVDDMIENLDGAELYSLLTDLVSEGIEEADNAA
jgi:hypothetical protein